MKILLHSSAFFPSVGGYEMAALLFARHFTEKGDEVHVITQTPDPAATPFPFAVIRQPDLKTFFKELQWCEVMVQESVSLKVSWQLLLLPRPLVIVHQTAFSQQEHDWRGYLKNFVSRFATNVCISESVADRTPPGKGKYLIHNPYQEELFRLLPEKRDKELVFLGRFVNEKGVIVLFEALSLLQKKGLYPKLTLIGGGHLENTLRQQATALRLDEQLTWTGIRRGEELVTLLNQHTILVVPSVYEEPFGIVALEGLACGCVPVVSERGGLKEAIGNCGLTFPNGDAAKLADVLQNLLADAAALLPFREKAPAHLRQFTHRYIGERYEAVFKDMKLK